jgi:predicted small lipoprotein YifL
MIKKFTLIILLFFVIISCGKKGDPKYVDPDKKAEIKEVLINSA